MPKIQVKRTLTIELDEREIALFQRIVRTAEDEINQMIRKERGSYLLTANELSDAQRFCESLKIPE